ncbi:peptidoglycan-binding protein, partial [Planctomycetota bacterium]
FEDTGDEFDLELGHMNPVSETSGVKARLHNLGYDCGPVDETMDEKTVEAIKAFQQDVGLSTSGELDQATRDALVREHGS